MPSQHKHPPISLRLPEADRAWLLEHSARSGRSVNAIIAEAVAAYRAAGAVHVITEGQIVSYGPVLDPPWDSEMTVRPSPDV